MTNLTISTPPNPHPKPGDEGLPHSPPLTPNARPPFLQPIIWNLPQRTTLINPIFFDDIEPAPDIAHSYNGPGPHHPCRFGTDSIVKIQRNVPTVPGYHIWKPHTLIAKRPIEFTLNRLYDDFMGSSHCMQVLTTSLCRRTSYHHPPTQTPYGFHLWKVYPVCASPPQTTMHTAYYHPPNTSHAPTNQ